MGATAVLALGAWSPSTPPAVADAMTSGIRAAAAPCAQVSANNATPAEMEAAFAAAGITRPDKWAHEVEEYRPYPADDPNFGKLRHELAKYHPSPETLEQILACLSLP